MLKFLMGFSLVLQVFASGLDREPLLERRIGGFYSSAANVKPDAFDYNTAQHSAVRSLPKTGQTAAKNTALTDANSSCTAAVKEYFLELTEDKIHIPLSVFEQIMGKDCGYLLEPSNKQNLVLHPFQLQQGLAKFEELFVGLSECQHLNTGKSALIRAVTKMPSVLVSIKAGKVRVSERIYALSQDPVRLKTNCSPLEFLLISFCCLQAEVVANSESIF